MTPAPESDRPPRRDFFLIPLIVLVTALAMLGGAELIAGTFFRETQQGNCSVPDALLGARYVPNCTYYDKAAETPLVQYVFNNCGYRTREPCGRKPAGSVRIALLGASTAEGFKVAYSDGLAPRAAAILTQLCRRPVEIQNMGVPGYGVIQQYLRADKALSLQPDMVMLVLTPYELVDVTDPEMLTNRDHPEAIEMKTAKKTGQVEGGNEAGTIARISTYLSDSRAAIAAQHFLFQNREQYIKLFLMHGDKADYLRVPLSAAWEKRLADLDLMLGGMADRIHRAGLPFAVVFTPQRVQAALSDPASRPPGVDPTTIGRRIAAIAARHGIVFIDTYDAFRHVPSPENLFLAVDGHMTAEGHRVVADAMVGSLTASGMPPFTGCGSVPDSDISSIIHQP